LYYFGARYYDPETGRFITKDPDGGDLDNPISQNPYIYANDNPVNLVDPDGKHVEVKIGAVHSYIGTHGGWWWDKHFSSKAYWRLWGKLWGPKTADRKWHEHLPNYKKWLKPGRKKIPSSVKKRHKGGLHFSVRLFKDWFILRRR